MVKDTVMVSGAKCGALQYATSLYLYVHRKDLKSSYRSKFSLKCWKFSFSLLVNFVHHVTLKNLRWCNHCIASSHFKFRIFFTNSDTILIFFCNFIIAIYIFLDDAIIDITSCANYFLLIIKKETKKKDWTFLLMIVQIIISDTFFGDANHWYYISLIRIFE